MTIPSIIRGPQLNDALRYIIFPVVVIADFITAPILRRCILHKGNVKLAYFVEPHKIFNKYLIKFTINKSSLQL